MCMFQNIVHDVFDLKFTGIIFHFHPHSLTGQSGHLCLKLKSLKVSHKIKSLQEEQKIAAA
jgi:hypothetical protein